MSNKKSYRPTRAEVETLKAEHNELRERLNNLINAMAKGSSEYIHRQETTNCYVEAVNTLKKIPQRS